MNDALAQLRRVLSKFCGVEEVRTLCFDLGLEYEKLGGMGTTRRRVLAPAGWVGGVKSGSSTKKENLFYHTM